MAVQCRAPLVNVVSILHGRHNRENVLSELKDLLHHHHFEVTKAEIIDYIRIPGREHVAKIIGPESWRDHLFVIGQKRSTG